LLYQILDLPLNGRNPINLAGGLAGVNTNTNVRQSVINGLRGSFSNITWDGIEINDNLNPSCGSIVSSKLSAFSRVRFIFQLAAAICFLILCIC
jgi:hypothetical protein